MELGTRLLWGPGSIVAVLLESQDTLAWYAIALAYLIASVCFIFGLKLLSHPETARKGNFIAATGMAIAVLATLLAPGIRNHLWILIAIVIGSVIGTVIAKKVKMTAMPQMVSFFNGMGGACAALIGLIEFKELQYANGVILTSMGDVIGSSLLSGHTLAILGGILIGSVSFSGSIIAMGKLEGFVTEKSVRLPFQQGINALLLLVMLGIIGYTLTLEQPIFWLPLLLFVLALIYGVLFVLPIGGADMPVVISLLNSFTGLAAACGGFIYDNQVMLTGGILVGSAGTILTILMCRAMNRSLTNVILGAFGGSAAAAQEEGEKIVREISPSDAAILLAYARKVMIVPGYGLAVAQAQHTVHELENLLEERGVEVLYAIHPVAGRMPGHMNVLLAEADVPYDKLLELEEANEQFPTTDVVLVIGANDVVNPAAKTDPSSPIYGMPILEVDQAKTVIVLKRSMRAGYAGIENELFYYPKTRMLFGDAKASLEQLIEEIKQL